MTAYRLSAGGPYLSNRVPSEVKATEGLEVYRRHVGGTPIRQVAREVGLSTTTAWRRFWWYRDMIIYPSFRNLPRDHVAPQRGTRACPSGEPPILDRPARVRIRHPLPSTRCTAHRSRDGRPCRRWARRGAAVCPSHGGNSPAVRRAAAERVARAELVDREIRARVRHHRELRVQDVRAMVLESAVTPMEPRRARRPIKASPSTMAG